MLRLVTFSSLCIFCTILVGGCTGGSGAGSGAAAASSSLPPPTSNSGEPQSDGMPVGVYKTTCPKAEQAIEGSGGPKHRGKIDQVNSDGSIVVDGILFSTQDAVVYVNGVCGTVEQLGTGDIVTVVGSSDSQSQVGNAAAIFSDADIAGPILELHADLGTLNVAGQPVTANSDTVYGDSIRPNNLSSLLPWENVAVSGFVQPDGSILATRIDRWPLNAGWRVAGTVQHIDTDTHLFVVDRVTVRYSDATLAGFLDGAIHAGDRVRVQGVPLWVVPGFDYVGINANAVEFVDELSPQPTVVASGVLTRWKSATDFAIEGVPVAIDSSTKRAGLVGDWLQGPPSPWITAVGAIDNQGVLRAELLDVENSGTVVLQGPVTGLDPSTRTVEIASVPVDLDSWTILGRVIDQGVQRLALSEVSIGDQLAALGDAVGPEGHVAAYSLIQRPASSAIYIWDWFDQSTLNRPEFSVHIGRRDLTIVTSDSTRFYWGHTMASGCSCGTRSADQFWNQPRIPPGAAIQTVEVFGTWVNDHVLADKVYWLQE